MVKLNEDRKGKFEQGRKAGLPPREAAEAAGYCADYGRQLAAMATPDVEGLIAFGWKQIRNRKNSDRVKQRYWEKLGEYLGLWGTGRKKPPDHPDEDKKAEGLTVL
jgi:hypothetical protein